ncbi:FliO/MopB family protein [Jatrophihabitans sp.]|uniref:FliO/MopB family protein n=1 Tax=Jatrophihabitans sp. TaxID=1932789 RepID=UPI002EECF4E0
MNTVAIIGRMLLALVFVLGVMWLLARWARKPMGGKTDRVMTVLARQQLSRTSSVTVLRVMDRALVLGVTEQGVQLLTETDLTAIEDALVTEAGTSRSWTRMISSGDPAADGGADVAEPSTTTRPELAARSELPSRSGGRRQAGRRQVAAGSRSIDGSVLSPKTWRQLVGAARELTVRR